MSNRRCVLSINLESNEDLLNDIDALLRERARAIVRQEAETMLGGELKTEAARVVAKKLENFERDSMAREVRGALWEMFHWDQEMRSVLGESLKAWCASDEIFLRNIVKDFAAVQIRKLAKDGILETAVKAVKEELTAVHEES